MGRSGLPEALGLLAVPKQPLEPELATKLQSGDPEYGVAAGQQFEKLGLGKDEEERPAYGGLTSY